MSDIARRVVVRGMVTGVGFRYATLREGGRYHRLRGHVRNVDERTVECVLQGEKDDVEAMIAWLEHGPPSARVLNHTVSEIPLQPGRLAFDVVY